MAFVVAACMAGLVINFVLKNLKEQRGEELQCTTPDPVSALGQAIVK